MATRKVKGLQINEQPLKEVFFQVVYEDFESVKNHLLTKGTVTLTGIAQEGDPALSELADFLHAQSLRNEDYWNREGSFFALVLNKVCYVFREDPSDGYRSSMRDVLKVKGLKLRNKFQGVKVHVKDSEEYDSDCFKLIAPRSQELIVELGTTNIDDYYPCFHCYFSAEVLETARLDNLPQAPKPKKTKMRL